MRIIKKLAALLLSGCMVASAFSLTASAASVKTMESGKTYSVSMKEKGSSVSYKVKVSESGTFKLSLKSTCDKVKIYFTDSKGENINHMDIKRQTDVGFTNMITGGDYMYCKPDWDTGKYSGNITYNVKKGTYNLKIVADSKGKLTYSAKFPCESGELSYLSMKVSKGTSIQLGTVVSGKVNSKSIKWSSSKSSVVSVDSSGKITAKAKGSATVSAKYGTKTLRIKVEVV